MEMALDKVRSLSPAGKEDYSGIFDLIEQEEMKPVKGKEPKEDKKEESLAYYGTKIVVCKGCDRKFYESFDRDMLITLFNCWHTFCLPCTNKYIDSEFVNSCGSLKCLETSCQREIDTEQIRAVIGPEKYELLYTKAIRKMCKLISCAKCKAEFEVSEGNPKDAPKKDTNNNPVKPEHAKDYAVNRFVCPSAACKTEQCRTCQATPYHLGMTCKEYKDRSLLK
jgi:hypothetical protein